MKLRELYDPAFFMVRSLPPQDRQPEPPSDHRAQNQVNHQLEPPTPSKPCAFDPASAEQIVTAWRNTMGMELNIETVRAHLETLKRWHSRLERFK